MPSTEPRNPFYLLLLLASVVFVATALAYALVPELERKALEAGQPAPPSPFREALRTDGWRWLLAQVAVVIFFGLASMVLDRLRALQKRPPEGTIPGKTREPSP
jgi:hypothetical protein